MSERAWQQLQHDVVSCRTCPRLVRHREQVAVDKRAAFREEDYWGLPVPGFGDHRARLLIIGLAPGAHGANRTGRMFTGDRSGDWLYRALHEAGFATQAESTARDDGLRLRDAYISATCRCAPPDNKPTTAELEACGPYLERELDLLRERLQVIVCLGGIAWARALRLLATGAWEVPRPRPRFGHGAETVVCHAAGVQSLSVLASYHPSQQNTFTGKLTVPMLGAVFARARELLS